MSKAPGLDNQAIERAKKIAKILSGNDLKSKEANLVDKRVEFFRADDMISHLIQCLPEIGKLFGEDYKKGDQDAAMTLGQRYKQAN